MHATLHYVPKILEFGPATVVFRNKLILGSGALSCIMWLVRIIENNKIDAYFRAG